MADYKVDESVEKLATAIGLFGLAIALAAIFGFVVMML